jgi:hypothetical protein
LFGRQGRQWSGLPLSLLHPLQAFQSLRRQSLGLTQQPVDVAGPQRRQRLRLTGSRWRQAGKIGMAQVGDSRLLT